MNTLSPLTLIGVGLALFASGLAHRWPAIARLDRGLFLALHRPLRRALPFFQVLWVLGTLEGILVAAGLVAALSRWQEGAAILLAYGVTVMLERLLKERIRRPRPFEAMPQEVQMGQPRRPRDPSYPSGDALRAWLLALTVARLLPPPWGWALVGLATLVSFGRIALGVHYPLDVVSGTGLGFLAAALAVWLQGLL